MGGTEEHEYINPIHFFLPHMQLWFYIRPPQTDPALKVIGWQPRKRPAFEGGLQSKQTF